MDCLTLFLEVRPAVSAAQCLGYTRLSWSHSELQYMQGSSEKPSFKCSRPRDTNHGHLQVARKTCKFSKNGCQTCWQPAKKTKNKPRHWEREWNHHHHQIGCRKTKVSLSGSTVTNYRIPLVLGEGARAVSSPVKGIRYATQNGHNQVGTTKYKLK